VTGLLRRHHSPRQLQPGARSFGQPGTYIAVKFHVPCPPDRSIQVAPESRWPRCPLTRILGLSGGSWLKLQRSLQPGNRLLGGPFECQRAALRPRGVEGRGGRWCTSRLTNDSIQSAKDDTRRLELAKILDSHLIALPPTPVLPYNGTSRKGNLNDEELRCIFW